MTTIRYRYAALSALCLMAVLVAAATASGTSGTGGTALSVPGGIQKYTMDQTLSDRGQEATIAFDGLAFMTGDSCSDTFLPPGKVADYAGFQYLRDNDATQMGHNTDFVTRISDNVLYILNDDQLKQFADLSKTEAPLNTKYGYMRYPLAAAFRAGMDGNMPQGSRGLSLSAVKEYSAELYDVDASISIARAKTYAGVIRSLNQTQRAYLDTMKSEGMADMPGVDSSAALKNAGQGNPVAMRTYASEMFAWYAGSVEADTYFCPERQATYFGSFYMKDRPAMGNAGYSISTSLTGDSGEDFLNLLTADQRAQITGLVDLQKNDLNGIVAKRTAIATELRKALAGGTIDESSVRTLSAQYGELDGEISYDYATHFAGVEKTLTSDQKTKMVALRNLAGYTCQGGYLYSQPIAYPAEVPYTFLFSSGTYDSSAVHTWLAGQQVTTIQTGNQPGPQEKGQGNTTAPGQGEQDRTKQGQEKGPGGQNLTAGSRQDRMPVEDVITALGQKGYDISGVRAAVQSGDRDAMKAWMKEFKKNNPGVAEAIEGTATDQSQAGRGERGNGEDPPRGQQSDAGSRNSDPFGWLTGFWKSLWGHSSPAPAAIPGDPAASRTSTTMNGNPPDMVPEPAGTTTEPFVLSSSAAGPDGGTLPGDYTCDGAGATPALSWTGVPAGTKEFALMMTTVAVDGTTRWNWILYHIPATASGIERNGSAIGTLGTGSHGTVMQYDPPCSQGPGAKTYTFTIYALSASPDLPGNATEVTGPVLTDAIAPVTLGKTSISLSYSR